MAKRLIDANALIERVQAEFKRIFWEAGEKVKPEDYYITRKSVFEADRFKSELDDLCGLVQEQPTVDAVEVVHGRWIPVIDESPQVLKMPMFFGYKCSVCGRCDEQEEPYCHCGAKMDGGKEK